MDNKPNRSNIILDTLAVLVIMDLETKTEIDKLKLKKLQQEVESNALKINIQKEQLEKWEQQPLKKLLSRFLEVLFWPLLILYCLALTVFLNWYFRN